MFSTVRFDSFEMLIRDSSAGSSAAVVIVTWSLPPPDRLTEPSEAPALISIVPPPLFESVS